MLSKMSNTLKIALCLLGLLLFLPAKVGAQTSGQLVIQSGPETAGTVYKLWKMDEPYSGALEESLSTKSIDALNQEFPQQYQTDPADQTGKTGIEDIVEGIYYGLAIDVNTNTKVRTIVPFFVEVKAQKQTLVQPKSEQPVGHLKIIKVSSTNHKKRLPGVVFALYEKSSNTPVLFHEGQVTLEQYGKKELTTDANGEIYLSGLQPGTYRLEEVKPLSGYQMLKMPLEVIVTANQTVEIVVENQPSHDGGFKFRKVDSTNLKKGLPGAIFKVVIFDGEKFQDVMKDGRVYELTSDGKGYFEVTDLPYGEYYLIETVAPAGYQGLSEAIPFTVSAESYYKSEVLAIKNTPTPPNTPPIPPKIPDLPSTGEVRTKTIGLAIALMIIGGYLFIRDRRAKRRD